MKKVKGKQFASMIAMVLAASTLLTACSAGTQQEAANQEQETVKVEEVPMEDSEEENLEEPIEEMAEKEEKEEVKEIFEYFMPTKVENAIEYGLKFNRPEGYIYDYTCSSEVSVLVYTEKEKISVDRSTPQVTGWFDNYESTGEWRDDLWKIGPVEESAVTTEYGEVKILTGTSATNSHVYDICLINHDEENWYIERMRDEDASVPMTEIIATMFTAKPSTEVRAKSNWKRMPENNLVDVDTDKYGYIVETINWREYDTKPIKNVLGFNAPDGYEVTGSSKAESGQVSAKYLYNLCDKQRQWDNVYANMNVLKVQDTYLRNFAQTDKFEAGTKFDDFNEVIEVTKEESIETIYGTAHIFYQQAHPIWEDESAIRESEIALFYVNDEIVLIECFHECTSEKLIGYDSSLADILASMF